MGCHWLNNSFQRGKKTSHIFTKYTYPILQILQWNKALDFRKCDNFQKVTWAYILFITKVKSFELNRSILEVLCPLEDVGARWWSHSAPHLLTISLSLPHPPFPITSLLQQYPYGSWVEIFLIWALRQQEGGIPLIVVMAALKFYLESISTYC